MLNTVQLAIPKKEVKEMLRNGRLNLASQELEGHLQSVLNCL